MTAADQGNKSDTAAGSALRPHTSVILRDLLDDLDADAVPLSLILSELRGRAYGALSFVLALAGMLPGISFIAGTVLIAIAAQLVVARPVPKLPRAIADRRIPARHLEKWLRRLLPWLEQAERYVRPRTPILTGAVMRSVSGLMLILLGVALFVPVPFSQLLPGLAALTISFALLERDGPVLFLGLVLGALSTFLSALMLLATIRGVAQMFG